MPPNRNGATLASTVGGAWKPLQVVQQTDLQRHFVADDPNEVGRRRAQDLGQGAETVEKPQGEPRSPPARDPRQQQGQDVEIIERLEARSSRDGPQCRKAARTFRLGDPLS